MIKTVGDLAEAAKEVLFPRRCPVCGELTGGRGALICRECAGRLSLVTPPVCKVCGKEIADGAAELCPDCMGRRHAFAYGVALLNYDDAARASMARIKYKNKREYLDFYGAALAKRYSGVICRMGADVIVPVPVHRSRMRQRGFNQAEVLGRVLGKHLNLPVMPELLVRKKRTRPQKNLTPSERLRNLTDAFEAGKIPAGVERILLVDDIYTTGSTIEACARILRAAGAKRVYFAVICMTGGR